MAADAARTFGEAASALDHCRGKWQDGDSSITFESRDAPAVPGVDDTRLYTIRVVSAGEDPEEHEVLLARSAAVWNW